MLNQWDQPLWCGYSITGMAGGTTWGWCFPWEDFGSHTTTVRSVWRFIAHLVSYITSAEEPFWRDSLPQHAWVISSDHQPVSQGTSRMLDAGSHQAVTGKGSLPETHLPLLDHILTVGGGDSWCLAIITSHAVDLGGAKLPRPSQMDSMNAHKAKLRCQGGVEATLAPH